MFLDKPTVGAGHSPVVARAHVVVVLGEHDDRLVRGGVGETRPWSVGLHVPRQEVVLEQQNLAAGLDAGLFGQK